jgi:hypothetical protein
LRRARYGVRSGAIVVIGPLAEDSVDPAHFISRSNPPAELRLVAGIPDVNIDTFRSFHCDAYEQVSRVRVTTRGDFLARLRLRPSSRVLASQARHIEQTQVSSLLTQAQVPNRVM